MSCWEADGLQRRRRRRRWSNGREKGKVLAVAYQMRLRPAFQRLRDIIRSGALGELRVVAALLTQDWIERITASNRTWRFNPALSGGGELMDSGSHLCWTFSSGPPVWSRRKCLPSWTTAT